MKSIDFKVGDKIKWCSTDSYGSAFSDIFIKGKIYTVVALEDGPAILGEDNDYYSPYDWIEGAFLLQNPFEIKEEKDYYTWLAKR